MPNETKVDAMSVEDLADRFFGGNAARDKAESALEAAQKEYNKFVAEDEQAIERIKELAENVPNQPYQSYFYIPSADGSRALIWRRGYDPEVIKRVGGEA